jgi:hypothetical protein
MERRRLRRDLGSRASQQLTCVRTQVDNHVFSSFVEEGHGLTTTTSGLPLALRDGRRELHLGRRLRQVVSQVALTSTVQSAVEERHDVRLWHFCDVSNARAGSAFGGKPNSSPPHNTFCTVLCRPWPEMIRAGYDSVRRGNTLPMPHFGCCYATSIGAFKREGKCPNLASADPDCPLSCQVSEAKRTCHGLRKSDVHDLKQNYQGHALGAILPTTDKSRVMKKIPYQSR